MIVINTGATANNGLGDKLRDAFIIVNNNFESIDTLLNGTDVLTISQITGLQTALNNIQTQLDYIPGLQVDINSINNTIYIINQTLNAQNSSIADLYNEITNLQTQIYSKVEEAPIDGEGYIRKDAGWALAVTQTGATGPTGPTGATGTSGNDAINYIRRHDYVTNTSYCGYAKLLSLEDAPVWHISKIVVAIDGSTTTTTANNVKWSDRSTINYN